MRQRIPYVTTALIAVNLVVSFLAEAVSGSTLRTDVLTLWGGASVSLISGGQYWRLFTAMFLHSGIRHLLNNMLLLYLMGSVLEDQLGRVRCLILYLTSGVLANAICWRLYVLQDRNVVSVGASGAIFGVMGGILWIILRCRGRVEGLTLRQMLILLAFSLYFGFTSPDVANAAHLAGLAIGFLMAVPLYRHHKREADYV